MNYARTMFTPTMCSRRRKEGGAKGMSREESVEEKEIRGI